MPVIDVFAGAGGLGEGFSAFPDRNRPEFDVCLSIENDPAALETLRLRKFFNLFSAGDAPEEYYDLIRSYDEKHRMALVTGFSSEWAAASEKVLGFELGSDGMDEDHLDSAIETALDPFQENWALVGGPPCQAYSHAGRGRNRSKSDYRPEEDKRHFLYEEYLKIIARHWPAVVVMENVQGILSSRVGDRQIFENILRDLADPAGVFGARRKAHAERYQYRIYPLATKHVEPDLFGFTATQPKDYVVQCEKFGIPQRRNRVVLLAIRDDIAVEPALLQAFPGGLVTLGSILSDMPRLRSGLTEGEDTDTAWMDALYSAQAERWFDQVPPGTNRAVQGRILRQLEKLRKPKAGRGGDFVRARQRGNGSLIPETLKDWLTDKRLGGFSNHKSRSHMTSDLHRYLFCAAFAEEHEKSPNLSDFPSRLLPNHRSVADALNHGNFSDRFRVQVKNQPATTITSHIAKDGHYYIHPDLLQCRSLTVREVARLQTFPDNYFFCGNQRDQYTQIGNAVPPFLSWQIAEIISGLFKI